MHHSSLSLTLPLVAICLGLASCAGTRPVAYSALASSSHLQPTGKDKLGKVPYEYPVRADRPRSFSLLIDPVVIYRGEDHQFEKISEEEKATLARAMQEQFGSKLATRYKVVGRARPDTIRVKLTLTGARKSTPVIGTFMRFDLAGGPYNVVQSIRGGEGALTGSVSFAVEIYEASTGRLLSAYVEKQYPNALNVKASLSPLDASKVGIQKGADELVERLARFK